MSRDAKTDIFGSKNGTRMFNISFYALTSTVKDQQLY